MNLGLALLPTFIVSVALILFPSSPLLVSVSSEREWLVVVDVQVARSFELFAVPVYQIFIFYTCMIR